MDLGGAGGNGRGGQGGVVGGMTDDRQGGVGGRLDLSSNGQAPSGFHNNAAGAEGGESRI